MTEMEAIRARHSVRQYLNNPLKPDELAALRGSVDACNEESGLHIQLVTNEPRAFEGTMARYGKFSGVSNYFALVGKADKPMPDWFKSGMEAVLLAPTAVNQQKFLFTLLEDGKVSAQPGHAFYVKMDLGIAKYHFEIGAGKENFQWA